MDHRPPRSDQPYAWDDERLSAYLDGELSAPEQAQLEARLVVDPELRQLVDELRSVRQQLEILPEYRLQAAFAEQVLRRAEQEMLLSPLAAETTSTSIVSATTPLPTVATTMVQPTVLPQPARLAARGWHRGAIWTAVAAAAVLLLIVTNRPLDPEQDPIAQHDPDNNVTVEHGAARTPNADMPVNERAAAKLGVEKTEPNSASSGSASNNANAAAPASTADGSYPRDALVNSPTPNGVGANRDSLPQSDLQKNGADKTLQNQIPPRPNAIADGVDEQVNNAVAAGDMPAKPAAQLAKSNDGAVLSKQLLKSQGATQPHEKQEAASRKELIDDLTPLLASAEFSRLAMPREEARLETKAKSADEHIMVVYVTPNVERESGRAFEALLASNSISLAEISLSSLPHDNQKRRDARPPSPAPDSLVKNQQSNKQESPVNQPPGDDQPSKSGEAKDPHPASKPASAVVESEGLKPDNAPLASEFYALRPVEHGNQFYYLEADEGQVHELLQQLRSASQRFTKLSVATRELPVSATANLHLEKSQAEATDRAKSDEQQSALAMADSKFDAASAAAEPRSPVMQAERKKIAEFAAPAAEAMPAAGMAAPGAALPPPVQAPAVPSAPPTASAPPATVDIPPAVTAKFFEERRQTFGAVPSTAKSKEVLADTKGPSESRPNTLGERTNLDDEGVVAYRLSGVETLAASKNTMATNGDQKLAGAGGGGMSPPQLDSVPRGSVPPQSKRNSSPQDGQSGKADTLRKTNPSEPRDADNTTENEAEMRSSAAAALPHTAAQPTDRRSTAADPMSRSLTRGQEAIAGSEQPFAEAGKKTVPPATKRVRVLFVIEHKTQE